MRFDLKERTCKFGQDIIRLCKKIKKDEMIIDILTQLIRSGTSVGANYAEADNAESKRDFIHKIGICRKESMESHHWLNMLLIAEFELTPDIHILLNESRELNLIFNSIYQKLRN